MRADTTGTPARTERCAPREAGIVNFIDEDVKAQSLNAWASIPRGRAGTAGIPSKSV